jgi:hypothetical protein
MTFFWVKLHIEFTFHHRDPYGSGVQCPWNFYYRTYECNTILSPKARPLVMASITPASSLPFEGDLALSDLYNFEFPLPKDDLYQVWLKLVFLVPETIFNNFQWTVFCSYLPLGKGVVLHLYNSEFPLPTNDVCQLWPSGSGEVKNVNV